MGCEMRKVFLDELPRWESGSNKGKINWKESIGHKVSYIYNDKNGEIEIVNYKKETQDLFIISQDEKFKIKTYDFVKSKISKIIGKRTKEFKIEIGTVLKDDKRDLMIIDREYREYIHKPTKEGRIYKQNIKYYKYKCNICGYDDGWTTESLLLNRKDGCACCRGIITVPEINSIWITDRWMCNLGVSEKDAKKYTRGSGKKITVKCPDCGNKKEIPIDSIRGYKSINCVCGDSYSYPEKFTIYILNQLGVDFKTQLNKTIFDWCDKYRYDFYLPNYNVIIEVHGKQHYTNGFNGVGGKTVEEEQMNDKIKKELAINNGIKDENYIVIDCRYSELDYIKNSIINSKLNELFDLSKVDWIKCEEFALKNIVKEVCSYWNDNNDNLTTGDLARFFKLSPNTVTKYLKKGSKLGWTLYNPKQEMIRVAKINGQKSRERNSIPIAVIKNGSIVGSFNSIKELSELSEEILGIKLNRSCIGDVVRGKREYHKGFTFKYISDGEREDYLKLQEII